MPTASRKDHVVQGALDEVLVLHRTAAVFDDERPVAELLDEGQRIQEDFGLARRPIRGSWFTWAEPGKGSANLATDGTET